MDSVPTALMSFRAIRDNFSGEVIDFEWVTANLKTDEIVDLPLNQLIGARLSALNSPNKTLGLFDLYVQVVETGNTNQTETTYEADGINGWYDIRPLNSATD